MTTQRKKTTQSLQLPCPHAPGEIDIHPGSTTRAAFKLPHFAEVDHYCLPLLVSPDLVPPVDRLGARCCTLELPPDLLLFTDEDLPAGWRMERLAGGLTELRCGVTDRCRTFVFPCGLLRFTEEVEGLVTCGRTSGVVFRCMPER